MAVLESMFGVVGGDFVVVAAGTSIKPPANRAFYNPDVDRVKSFGSHMVLATCGLSGSSVRSAVHGATGQYRLDTVAAVADVTRLAAIAHHDPVDVLVAGYDGAGGPAMYAVGSKAPPERVLHAAAAGCGSHLCTPVMQREYRPDMTVKEAVALVERCIKEVRRLGLECFLVMKVDNKHGAREIGRRVRKPKRFPEPDINLQRKSEADMQQKSEADMERKSEAYSYVDFV